MDMTSSSGITTSKVAAYLTADLSAGSDTETTSDSTGSLKDFIVSDGESSTYEQASRGEESSDDWAGSTASRSRRHRSKESLGSALRRIEMLLHAVLAELRAQGEGSEGCTRERRCGVEGESDSLDMAGGRWKGVSPRPRAVSSP